MYWRLYHYIKELFLARLPIMIMGSVVISALNSESNPEYMSDRNVTSPVSVGEM